METAQNVVKSATGQDSQFSSGHQVPIQNMPQPSLQRDMKGPDPADTQVPTEDGGYQTYKAAQKLTGKKAIITGGDSGIGRAIAILFVMEGADKFLAYLPEEQKDAEDTKKAVEEHGGKCYLYATDLREQTNCKKWSTKPSRKWAASPPQDQWVKPFDTNIHPYFYLSKYALPHLQKNPGSTVINYASVNAYIGRPDLLDYTSTKGAIVAFTRGLSNQQLANGIRVNAVCPGPVWTPLIPSTMKHYAQDQSSQTPMGRPGQPSEIATCFVFLASQDSSFMSGQCLHPNGGVVVNG